MSARTIFTILIFLCSGASNSENSKLDLLCSMDTSYPSLYINETSEDVYQFSRDIDGIVSKKNYVIRTDVISNERHLITTTITTLNEKHFFTIKREIHNPNYRRKFSTEVGNFTINKYTGELNGSGWSRVSDIDEYDREVNTRRIYYKVSGKCYAVGGRKNGIFSTPHEQIQSQSPSSPRKESKSIGTGFFVTDKQVITNHHVVSDCSAITVNNSDYRSSATVASHDKKNDLALLMTNKKAPAVAEFRSGRGIRTGNEIVTAGYPLGEVLGYGLKATTGNVSSLSGVGGDIAQMQITSPVQGGNSGGPVLDKSGNVVGVVMAKFGKKAEEILDESLQNVNFAIKSTTAQAFLDANDIDYSTSRSSKNIDTADIVDQAKKYTVQVQCMN